MAQIRLHREEMVAEELPKVCIRCGAQAEFVQAKTFHWFPDYISVIMLIGVLCFSPLLLLALILLVVQMKSMKAVLPVCAAHKNHWRSFSYYLYGGMIFFVLLGVLVIVAWIQTARRFPDLGLYLLLGSFVLGLLWLISAAIWQNRNIRPSEMTNEGMTLIKVAPGFVTAFEDFRCAVPEDDKERPRRRGRAREGSEQFYNQKKPGSQPAQDETFEEGRP